MPTASPSVLTPTELQSVIELFDRLLANLLHLGHRPRSLERAVEDIGTALVAGNCAIFLLTRGDTSTMDLVASKNRWWLKQEYPVVQLPTAGTVHGGLTAWAAGQQKPVRLDAKQIRESLHRGTNRPDHLGPFGLLSFISVPLFSADNQFEGLLKCENKTDDHGNPSEVLQFTEGDLEILRLLARVVLTIANEIRDNSHTPMREKVERVARAIDQTSNRDEILDKVIATTVELLVADRGDFAWWTGEAGTLVYAAQGGPTTNLDMQPDKRVPDRSFVRSVFENLSDYYRLCPDINEGDVPYVPAAEGIRSELAVRVDLHGNPVGVLNVESRRPNFFRREDVDLLRLLAQQAARAVQRVQRQRLMQTALDHKAPPARVLQPILEGVLEACGFDGGILYRHDRARKCLRVAASRAQGIDFEPGEFVHFLDKPSFAKEVFVRRDTTMPVFWEEGATEVPVDREGLKKWNIHSPLLGYPLIFEGECVGCLVLWSIERRFPPSHPTAARLDEFARLASAKIAFWEAEQERDENLARFRALAESSPLLVFSKRKSAWITGEVRPPEILPDDPKFVFEWANKNFLTYVSRSLSELEGKTDWDLFPTHALEYYRDDCATLRGERIVGKPEKNVRPGELEERDCLVWKTAIAGPSGELDRIEVIFFDRTAEKKLEDEKSELLAQNQTLLKDLIHRVDGCFRHAHGILDDQLSRAEDAQHRALLEECQARLACMTALVGSLYRQPRGAPVSMREFLTALIIAVEAAFKPLAGNGRIRIKLDVANVKFPEGVAMACGLIVTELLANSLRHGFAGLKDGEVAVRLSPAEPSWELTVIDNGVGTDHLPPFAADTVGLGLVGQLAEQQLKGNFELALCEPDQERRGTRFRAIFRLDAALRSADLKVPPPDSDKPPILIVEDQVIEYLRCGQWLGSDYHILGRAETREDAIRAVIEHHPRVVIMDVDLGESDSLRYEGINIAEAIRKIPSPVPILLLTHHPWDDARVACAETSIRHCEVLHKTVAISDNLRSRVRHAILHQIKGRKVFVCYSRADKALLDEFLLHLKVIDSGGIEEWWDEKIATGEDWGEQIDLALHQTVAAVILASPSFRASRFIQDIELPRLLRQASMRGTKLCWVKLYPFNTKLTDGTDLAELQFAGNSAKSPVGELADNLRPRVWNEIAVDIQKFLAEEQPK